MLMRHVGRGIGQWIFVLSVVAGCATATASCGSSGGNSTFDGGGGLGDGSTGLGDGTMPSSDSSIGSFGDDSSTDGSGGGGNCKTCAQLGVNCGSNGDGCGHIINCGTCPGGEICGGGGFNKCGGGSTGDGSTSIGDGGSICTPLTTCGKNTAGQDQNCGFVGDGCGGPAISCGPACSSPQFCGGGGFNVCGGNNGLTSDGSVPCTPLTACTGGQNCGYQSDGCGGAVNCGSCQTPQFCGGGGFNICGGNNGVQPDGATSCTPRSCASQGFNCGPAGDGCGGLLQCGTCTLPNICGGAGVSGSCGNSACTNLCQHQPVCDGGQQTIVSGKVIAGTIAMFGTPDPVPNVLVYVPNAPLQPFAPGVECSQCGAEVSGSPLVETTTAFDGTFTLTNVPVGTNIPIVIQLGRWRRETFINVTACTTTSNVTLQMPQTQLQGDIPFTAISTGSVDSLECVLLKMGVDQSEFTSQSGSGRIHMYSGDTGSGPSAASGTTNEEALMAEGGTYMNYDQILFPCWGGEYQKPSPELSNLVSYGNAGGHFFATHFSYTWLYNNYPFSTTAAWDVNANSFNSKTATIQLPPTNPQGQIFTNWLVLVGAVTPPADAGINATVSITDPRHDVDSVNSPSVNWMSGKDGNKNMLFHYTFDTPVQTGDAGVQQCGHAIFSDFHVANAATSPSTIFPAECMNNETTGNPCTTSAPCPMTPQERILEYMIWDLGQCVPGPPTPPGCTPKTCQQQGINCGPAGDGCGNEIMCGTCTPPMTCGGGGTSGVCGSLDGSTCTPKSCAQQNISCGPAGDGCGNEIPSCGVCIEGATCGGGGVPGKCGYPDAGSCTPLSCSQQNIFCGPAGDGCGNQIMCGTCTAPQTCGGGGTPGQCGSPDSGTSCQPTSCAAQGLQCGMASDGCGNALNCGTCGGNQTCSVSGKCVGVQ